MTTQEIEKALSSMPKTYDKVMEVVDAIEKQRGDSLIIYPDYCYWYKEEFGYLSVIHGDDRLDSIYKAVKWYAESEM
jgi:hypothetical protein